MNPSNIYLGASSAFEAQQQAAIDGKLAALHQLAQRVFLGISFADKFPTDVEGSLEKLERRFAEVPVTHLVAGIVHLWRGHQEEAARSLERALELAAQEGAPWPDLIPTDRRWSCDPIRPSILETGQEHVFRVLGEARPKHAAPFAFRGPATFVRLASGDLACINPVAFDDAVTEQIQARGEVRFLLAPGKYHNENLVAARERFPKAKLYGSPGHVGYPTVAHIPFDGILDDDHQLMPGELTHRCIHGTDQWDVWFIDHASRTLIVNDAVTFLPHGPEQDPFRTTFEPWVKTRRGDGFQLDPGIAG